MKNSNLKWRVHTANLISEILENGGQGISAAKIPLQILAGLLVQVGERAAQLNDERLNELMIRLTIYSVADPFSPDFNQSVVDKYLKHE